MTTTSSSASRVATPKPVVGDAPKMPKLKNSSKVMANVNAFSIAFAIFIGAAAIFAAIAGFTKGDWSFSVPYIGTFFGGNLYSGSSLFTAATFVLIFGILSILTIRKITSVDDMKGAWKKVMIVFGVITAIFTIELVATAIYSLLSIGTKTVDQGYLWLSSFLPIFILALLAFAVTFMAKKIADGNTQVLRIASYVAVAVAVVAFILVIVSTLVGFYAKKSTLDYGLEDYKNILDQLY